MPDAANRTIARDYSSEVVVCFLAALTFFLAGVAFFFFVETFLEVVALAFLEDLFFAAANEETDVIIRAQTMRRENAFFKGTSVCTKIFASKRLGNVKGE